MPTNYNRANLITESATLFPDNNTQEISPADLRQWLEDGTTSFVTQKDKSTLENAIFENKASTLASGATVDLNTATGNFLHISGTSTINSFGTCPAGARFIIVFDAAATLTYNATSLIIPGLANKTAAAGDCCMIVSEGSGNWRIVGYFAISGGGGGGSGTVTSVATAGLISGGTITTTGTITTSMATDKLVGRYDAGTGIMQEITVGSGLTLTGAGTLNNTATPTPTGYYGAFSDFNNQTAAAINTGYPMTLGTTDLSNQVTVVSGSRVTIANTGIYNIQWSAQFINSNANEKDVFIWLRKNGTDVVGSSGRISVPKTHGGIDGHIVPSWNFLLDAVASDYYEFVWSTNSTDVSIATLAAGSPQPSTASIVLTVTQQAGIMAGTGITGMIGTSGSTQTGATQTFSSSEMTITSAANTHTFAIPDASDTARGLVSTSDQTLSGIKTFGNGASAGEIRFLEPSGDGSNYVALKSQAITADYSITLPPAAPSGAQYLQSTGVGGVLQWTSGTTTGVSSIGTINSATKNPNGAVISGSNIIMQTADATNVGLVSIGTQTFAGAKTFSGAVTMDRVGSASNPQLSISAGGGTHNWINFATTGNTAPTTVTRSGGTRFVFSQTAGVNSLDYAIGLGTNEVWLSAATTAASISFYVGTTTNVALKLGGFTANGLTLDAAGLAATPQLNFNGSGRNWINFSTNGLDSPTNGTAPAGRSSGTRIVFAQTVSASSFDYAIGQGASEMWFSVSGTSATFGFWAGTSRIAFFGGGAGVGLTFGDAQNIVFNTTTGTKIATATTQKLAFWNKTPIVQPTTAITGAAFVQVNTTTAVSTASTFGGYTLDKVVAALINTGILA